MRRSPARLRENIRAIPGLARISIFMGWRTAEWGVETMSRAGSRLVRAARSGESPRELMRETGEEAREYLRKMLGILEAETDYSPQRQRATAKGEEEEPRAEDNGMIPRLRERGAELLRRSADVNFEEDTHPAYERILADLAPDEARILRLLVRDGPQPSVDVRSGLPLASELVAPGLNMIGAEAGCRHLDRVHAYLTNLNRLGLVWFSREEVSDRMRYQVLEAQPEVLDALKSGGRLSRTVRRSIQLTRFGEDFCAAVLPPEEEVAETERRDEVEAKKAAAEGLY